jgi:ketosteroid isomerase-like protein
MSRENVEIVLGAFDAFGRGDVEGVLRVCDEDIVITQPAELLDASSSQQYGHAGVLEAFAIWPEQWDDYHIDNVRVLADPAEHVVVATRQSGRGRQSGIEVTMEFTFVFTLQDRKIAEWRLFLHEAQALEAAGLSE